MSLAWQDKSVAWQMYQKRRAVDKGWKTILSETRRRERAKQQEPMPKGMILKAVGCLNNPLTGDTV